MKYRVWDNENNCYYEPIYEAYKGNLEELLLGPSGQLSMRTYSKMIHESMFPDRFVVEFCAGLNDKNGKDIYEGDKVIVVSGEEHQGYREFDKTGYIKYSGMCFDLVVGDVWQGIYNAPDFEIEVIGTIHD